MWDNYECHIEESVSKDLKVTKIEWLIFPGGCRKYRHAPDVSWNKTSKAQGADEYGK